MIEHIPLKFTHEGADLIGQIVKPEGQGPFPAVLVKASAFGLGEHSLRSARRLAELGYLAVATDMYGGGAFFANPETAGDSFAHLMGNPALARARSVAWVEAASGLADVDANRVAAIGYCFGGKCVLELARAGADVKAVVSFHGLLSTASPAQAGAIKGEVVAYCGARDLFAPVEQIEGFRLEMEAAGARYQITTFGEAAHSFTDPEAAKSGRPGIAYHALSDSQSWAGTVALLDSVLS